MDEIGYRLADGVGEITLNRPEAKNALDIPMRDELIRIVRDGRADPAVRALLITGTGDAFCAGADMGTTTVSRSAEAGFDTRSTQEALRAGVQTLVRELWELDKPTVAAVNGTAVGPGAHLALACDLVVIAEDARLMWSFAKWGLVVDAAGAYLLPRLVGLPRAKRMVLLGEGFTGAEAVAEGLAYASAPAEDVLARATELARTLAAGPTRSLGLSKALLNRSFETDLPTSLDLEGAYQSLATTSEDLQEGMAAFKQKRPPNFTGR